MYTYSVSTQFYKLFTGTVQGVWSKVGELAGAAFTKTRANEEEKGAETSGRKGLCLLSYQV